MSKDAQPPPSVDHWQAQNLRMVVFHDDPKAALNTDWWQNLTGTEPDSSVRKKLEREDGGIFDGMQLVVSVDAFRITWVLAFPVDPEKMINGAPLLGPYVEKKEEFLKLMLKWLGQSPKVSRIGIAGTLMQEVPNREESYKLLDRYLRHVEVHTDSSDMMYRVNRKRTSKVVENLEINCLGSWLSGRVVTSLSAQQAGEKKKEVENSEKNYCVFEFDVNTAQEFSGKLPPERLPAMLTELVNISTELATRGDIRN